MVRKSTTKGSRTGPRAASTRRKAGSGASDAGSADATTPPQTPPSADDGPQETRASGQDISPDTADTSSDAPHAKDDASETVPDTSGTPDSDPVTPDTVKQPDTVDPIIAGADDGAADVAADKDATDPEQTADPVSSPVAESARSDGTSDAEPGKPESATAQDDMPTTDAPAREGADDTEKGASPSEATPASDTSPVDTPEPSGQGRDSAIPSSTAGVAALASVGAAPVSTTPESNSAPKSGSTPGSTPGSTSKPPSGAAPARSGSGFLPLVLGGIIAGGIGFGAQYLLTQDQRTEETGPDPTAELAADLASLRADIEALPPAPDLAPLEAEIAELRDAAATRSGVSEIEAELDQLRAALAAEDGPDLGPIEARIEELVTQRTEMMIAQDSALESLRATLAENETQIAALRAAVDDLRDLAERRVVEAESAVDTALARGALDSLRAALSTGAPYPDALSQLADAGVTVPPELAGSAASGIPTLEMLQERFPDAARVALRDTLQSAPADNTRERLGNFLRAQVGARSTAPREGDDPDAILSRAGAFVEAGALRQALDELESLPETTQSSMASWITGAQARLDAETVLPMLTDTIMTE